MKLLHEGAIRADRPVPLISPGLPVAVAADPAAAAKAYGALMGRCSFCDTAITDEGSVEVGYGPVCAKRFGLPHTPKGTKVLAA